jgi:adenosylmethionine-8-amino-7-oxononanoate aminotransferase
MKASTQLVVYGHPIASAAAVANLEIWRSELVPERIVARTQVQVGRLARSAFTSVREIDTILTQHPKTAERYKHREADILSRWRQSRLRSRRVGAMAGP